MTNALVRLIVVVVALSACALGVAGELQPPAGTPQPSMVTLGEIYDAIGDSSAVTTPGDLASGRGFVTLELAGIPGPSSYGDAPGGVFVCYEAEQTLSVPLGVNGLPQSPPVYSSVRLVKDATPESALIRDALLNSTPIDTTVRFHDAGGATYLVLHLTGARFSSSRLITVALEGGRLAQLEEVQLMSTSTVTTTP